MIITGEIEIHKDSETKRLDKLFLQNSLTGNRHKNQFLTRMDNNVMDERNNYIEILFTTF